MSTTHDTHDTLTESFDDFLHTYYNDAIADLAQSYPHDSQSLEISWYDLFQYDPDLADDYLDNPDHVHPHLEDALTNYDLPVDKTLEDAVVRVVDLETTRQYHISDTRSHHVGEYLGLYGQVSKVSDVKPYPTELAFECQRCGTITPIPQSGKDVQSPHECQGCERDGPYEINIQQSTLIDRQVLRLQEPPEQAAGERSEQLEVYVERDLAGHVGPGDRIDVYGTYEISSDDLSDQTHGLDTQLHGRGVDIEDRDYDEISVDEHLDRIQSIAAGDHGDPFELITDSIAPKHHGDDDIKLAIALQMFGGNRVEYPDGAVDRGDSHILLMGDPGAGKSSLLRAVETLAPRSVYASGKGASAVGLTAAAVADDFGDSKWGIEAGALVLANKGIACVDEIDKIDEDAISSLHDALESQRVEVNKAGINATMPAQTALLAAGNPKYGRFDPYEPIGDQIELGPTLLSRFDLMFMVSDQPDADQDSDVAERMIESRRIATANASDNHQVDEDDLDQIRPAIDPDVLRAYIAHAKQTIDPVIQDDEVKDRLQQYFVQLRLANGEGEDAGPVPTTFRKLEAIERLAEASAKIRLSDDVNMEDVERSVSLVESSMRDVGIDPEDDVLDIDVVETGISRSQRDRVKTIVGVLQDHDADRHPVDLEAVFADLEEEGIGRDRAKHELKTKLMDRGKAYCPSTTNLDEAEEIHYVGD